MKTPLIFLLLVAPAALAQNEAADTLLAGAENSEHTTYVVAGPAVGSPGGINILAGLYSHGYSIRCSGGAWQNDWRGVQLALGLPFGTSAHLTHGVSFLAGYFRTAPLIQDETGTGVRTIKQVHYLGLAYNVLYAGFSLEAGLGSGKGDYANPQLLVQCGYVLTIP